MGQTFPAGGRKYRGTDWLRASNRKRIRALDGAPRKVHGRSIALQWQIQENSSGSPRPRRSNFFLVLFAVHVCTMKFSLFSLHCRAEHVGDSA